MRRQPKKDGVVYGVLGELRVRAQTLVLSRASSNHKHHDVPKYLR